MQFKKQLLIHIRSRASHQRASRQHDYNPPPRQTIYTITCDSCNFRDGVKIHNPRLDREPTKITQVNAFSASFYRFEGEAGEGKEFVRTKCAGCGGTVNVLFHYSNNS